MKRICFLEKLSGATLVLCCLIILASCETRPEPREIESQLKDSVSGLWDEVKELYEKAREHGDKVPNDVADWARQDIRNIGDWEYLIVEIEIEDPVAIETQLNELGGDRWECYWVEDSDGGKRFYMKRPIRVYLRHIPLSQLLKLIPMTGDSTE